MHYIGTSGWHYDHWKGIFYPEKFPSSEYLSYYATLFNTVEINNTFYHLPQKKTFETWKDSVPKKFLFSVKASRYITHVKNLLDPQKTLKKFYERIKLLDDHLGPILIQLPPHWNKNRERLKNFIDQLSHDFDHVFEFRDSSWLDDEIFSLLEKNNQNLCLSDFPKAKTPYKKTGSIIYMRFHGVKKDPYKGLYKKKDLKKPLSFLKKQEKSFCYFNNDQKAYAVKDAYYLKTKLISSS